MRAGAVILAAGDSSRLGQAKQLLQVDGESLLRRCVRVALHSKASPIAVVLGAQAGVCAAEIADLPAGIVIHSTWRDGLASSIVFGLHSLLQRDPELEAVVFMVCDQPHLTTEVLDALIDAHEDSGKGVIACHYDGTTGVPALFTRPYFEAIARLTGDQGAKSLFNLCANDMTSIAFPRGGADIDTPADYAQLVASPKQSVVKALRSPMPLARLAN